jgi:hypothetical protein
VGDLDRDPDAPAVLAHVLKLDREGQDPRHLALRRLVEQAVDLVANGRSIAAESAGRRAAWLEDSNARRSGKSAEGQLTLSIYQIARSWSAASGGRVSEAQRP